MILNILISTYYSQLIRTKHNPTYVERKILKEYANNIREYYLEIINEIKKKIENDFKYNSNFYFGWSVEYYNKMNETHSLSVTELIQTIKNQDDNNILSLEIKFNNDETNTQYGYMLPTNELALKLKKYILITKKKNLVMKN